MKKVEQEIDVSKKAQARQKFKAKYEELYLGLLNPELGHSERIKSSKMLEDVYKCGNDWHKEPHLESLHGKDDWQVERIEYGECGICGHPLLAEDYHKGDVVCEGCGTVVHSTIYDTNVFGRSLEPLPPVEESMRRLEELRFDELNIIWKERKRKAKIESTPQHPIYPQKPKARLSTRTKRCKDYLRTLKKIGKQLHMTQDEIECVEGVILDKRYNLSKFHSKARDETIIAGFCRFKIKASGRSDGSLRFNLPAFRDNNLNKDKYKIIAMNIVERRITNLMR